MRRYGVIILGLFCFLPSCGPNFSAPEAALIQNQEEDLVCQDFQIKFWDSLDQFTRQQKRLPDAKILMENFNRVEKKSHVTPEVLGSWRELYQVLLEEAPDSENLKTLEQFRELLAALELGDETTIPRKNLKVKLRQHFDKIENQGSQKNCLGQMPKPSGDHFEDRAKASQQTRALSGMKWTFATAYQSCAALKHPPLTLRDPDILGVILSGRHTNGRGKKFYVGDLVSLLNTHYYYAEFSPSPVCQDNRKTPLIYDYGGKPFASDDSGREMNLFVNEGTGTEVLGIDCSAAIFSALATAGLRLEADRPLRARHALGVGSRMFLEPQKNGLNCLEPVVVESEKSLEDGDIAAINGHVLMIGKVGLDPFGFKKISDEASCNNLSYRNFDFEIWQSGPYKGGIGLQRQKGRDYLKTSLPMRFGFESYARSACLGKFRRGKEPKKSSYFSLTRHKGTPECRDTRIKIVGESCIKECPQLFE